MDIVSVDGRCFYRSKIEAARKESRFVVPIECIQKRKWK